MPFHFDDRLAASVEIVFGTDAFEAIEDIAKVRVEDVEVHGVFLLFGEVDAVAWISTPFKGTVAPTIRLARWVNAVRALEHVKTTKTSVIVAERHPQQRAR